MFLYWKWWEWQNLQPRWEHNGSCGSWSPGPAHLLASVEESWCRHICTQLRSWALLRPCNGMCAAGHRSTRTCLPFHCQYPAFVFCKCSGQAQEREQGEKRVQACRRETCQPAGKNTWLEKTSPMHTSVSRNAFERHSQQHGQSGSPQVSLNNRKVSSW